MNKTSQAKPETASSKPEVSVGISETNTDMAGLSCKPIKRVFFLKTSKTGSTTVANIMARFAFKHNLDALLGFGFYNDKSASTQNFDKFFTEFDEILFLGEQPNGALFFTGDYLPFSPQNCYLGRDIKPKLTFDMSFVHLRYKREMTETLIKPGHKRITILRDRSYRKASSILLTLRLLERDPIKQFKSTWKYYNVMLKGFRQKLPSYDEDDPDFIAEITEFLKRPDSYLSGLR